MTSVSYLRAILALVLLASAIEDPPSKEDVKAQIAVLVCKSPQEIASELNGAYGKAVGCLRQAGALQLSEEFESLLAISRKCSGSKDLDLLGQEAMYAAYDINPDIERFEQEAVEFLADNESHSAWAIRIAASAPDLEWFEKMEGLVNSSAKYHGLAKSELVAYKRVLAVSNQYMDLESLDERLIFLVARACRGFFCDGFCRYSLLGEREPEAVWAQTQLYQLTGNEEDLVAIVTWIQQEDFASLFENFGDEAVQADCGEKYRRYLLEFCSPDVQAVFK